MLDGIQAHPPSQAWRSLMAAQTLGHMAIQAIGIGCMFSCARNALAKAWLCDP